MTDRLRCMIYARRSSDRQNEESTAQQINACREFAEKQGYIIIRDLNDPPKMVHRSTEYEL